MHAALEKFPELLPDRVHPNTAGAAEMAKAAAQAITGK
jgi:lysophospholipase L1-like esterase